MEAQDTRRSGTFNEVVQVLTTGRHKQTKKLIVATCKELQEIEARLLEIDREMRRRRGPTWRSGQIEAWKQVARGQLVTLKDAAAAYLGPVDVGTDNGKPKKLTVPHHRAKPAKVAEAAELFAATLRPFMSFLVPKGFEPNALEEVADSVGQMKKWETEAPDSQEEYQALVADAKSLITKGRKLVKMLKHELRQQLKDDAPFRAAFDSASRVPDKIGAPKNSHIAQQLVNEAQGITRKARQIPRPQRFEERDVLPPG